MNNKNIVYKTFEIDTSIEYAQGKKINLSGIRIIKLVNRPSGIRVWISTDSNGTNLFPLINRGDGWELPNDFDPLYDIYIYTEGTNSEDRLILSYTGEKNFFVFGSNSIEKIGEIENIGQPAQIDILNALKNTFHKIGYPKDDDPNFIYNKTISGECGLFYSTISSNGTKSPQVFNQNTEGLIFMLIDLTSNMAVKNGNFYRVTIDGHIDFGSYLLAGINDNVAYNTQQSIHLGLYSDSLFDLNYKLDEIRLANSEDLYKVTYSKSQTKNQYFDLWGCRSDNQNWATSHPSFFNRNINTPSALVDLKYDQIVSGSFINNFAYFGILHNMYQNVSAANADDTGFHYSLNIQISKAFTSSDIAKNLFFL